MKKFLLGTIFGLTLAVSSVSVSAKVQEYILTKSETPIVVNGSKYSDTSAPIMSYNGTTYVPLRNFTGMVGATINYDSTTSTININTEPTNANIQTSSQKANTNSYIDIQGQNYISTNDIAETYLIPNLRFAFVASSDTFSITTKDGTIVISNIPYKTYNSRAYISVSYLENTILPAIES